MKHIKCSFQTELKFSTPVSGHTFSLMLTPPETPRQHVLYHRVSIDPDCVVATSQDGFKNCLHVGYNPADHDRLAFSMEALVETNDRNWDRTPPMPFLRFPTPLTAAGTGVRTLSAQCGMESAAPIKQAQALMECLCSHFFYQSGTTGVQTTAEEALSLGYGVCQDYAHILLALLRLRRIPCSYVTGLMLGEGASHAWVEIWDGEKWIPMDPTHSRLCGEDYVMLSRGRDFRDCGIEKGIFHSAQWVIQTQQVRSVLEEALN